LISQDLVEIKERIDSLKHEKITLLNRVNEISRHIEILEEDFLRANYSISDSIISVKISNPIRLFSIPSITNGKVIAQIPKKSVIKIYDYSNQFYSVAIDSTHGFVYYIELKDNTSVADFQLYCIEKNKIKAEIDQKRQDEDLIIMRSKDKEAQYQKLVSMFGTEIADRIVIGSFWLGMTTDMAVESLGQPNEIIKTVSIYGTFEQWLYKSNYLYFENGKLTSWQSVN
jgi:hypothetical protein